MDLIIFDGLTICTMPEVLSLSSILHAYLDNKQPAGYWYICIYLYRCDIQNPTVFLNKLLAITLLLLLPHNLQLALVFLDVAIENFPSESYNLQLIHSESKGGESKQSCSTCVVYPSVN